MVWRKYRPWAQWGKDNTRIFKLIYNARVKRAMGRFEIPEAVKALGVQVHNPNDPDFPRKTTPDPVQINHPAFRTPTLQDHILYDDKASLVLDGTEPMSEGVAQASSLLNTVVRVGFPKPLLEAAHKATQLLPNRAERLSDWIMHAERFDPTLEKLPRRHDPTLFWVVYPRMHGTPRMARNNILLDNLFRYSVIALKAQPASDHSIFAHFNDFRIDRDEPLSSRLPDAWSSEKLGLSDLVVRSEPHLTIQTSKAFSPWAGDGEVEATANETIPDIGPIHPTIDLKSDHIYNKEAVLARSTFPLHLHSVMWSHEQDQKYPWTKEQLAANAIAHCFSAALAQATRHGKDVNGRLKRPIVTRAVQLVDGRLDLVAFQLNTVDLTNQSSIKNIAWIEPAQQLYRPGSLWENYEKVLDLNEDAFVKFFAMLLG